MKIRLKMSEVAIACITLKHWIKNEKPAFLMFRCQCPNGAKGRESRVMIQHGDKSAKFRSRRLAVVGDP